ncbi:squalene/phytoene synthase family protein [Streptomyces sp. UNOC14_S4]|uniref:phytoene/squalene synthase family protein n=1 Tax=Streptomyces sp. UNOC14_S4 TaxID=2872340 RepID=UPI001E324D0B|nr:squalene/phytoene synthase family protein [Streptomyces sp. UNOC14_S4]MCC3771424.1 squalene/phytoene synthase family protein [Streptomyces sp. UNOC14_S4]
MTDTWNHVLDSAGIHDPRLREDYTRQRALVARYRRHAYVAVRLLLPGPVIPHVIATTAFMHHTDTVLDEGALPDRVAASRTWGAAVRDALETGLSDHPVLRPLLHTMTIHPWLAGQVEEFLAGAAADLDFAGFAAEADYQEYVDVYALPAFMLVAGLFAPGTDKAGFRAACRSHIDGSQRLDFVNDIAEDLAGGRLTLPATALKRHDVSRADLEEARDTPGTAALLRDQLAQARADLLAGRRLAGLTAPAHRPFVQALIALELLTVEAAARKGTALLRGSARPSVPASLRVLARGLVRTRRISRTGRTGR